MIVAEAVWQYTHHVLPGLMTHKGPILTVANWSGTWPGLVGMLNLNGSLTKAGVAYSTLWSEDFTDPFFMKGLAQWMKKGKVKHDTSHAIPYKEARVPGQAEKVGIAFAKAFREKKAIMGIFDEGCMGMYNAIIPDELLFKTGIFKERLSQSTLYAKMLTVADTDAREVYDWILAQRDDASRTAPTKPRTSPRHRSSLQCKMYIAAVRHRR